MIWNFYKDGVFYLNHINDFYIYEFGFENVQSILEEDYIKRKEEDYKIVQMNNTSLNIIDNHTESSKKVLINDCKFQRCPFNVGKPFFRWGYVILSQNKSDLVVF